MRAWRFRRSRDIEVVAVAVALLRALLDKHVKLGPILEAFPGYDGRAGGRARRGVQAPARDPGEE